MNDFIEVESVNVHNLKNISVKIPKNKLTVITGVSGSGKSSLAFDTIYTEGRKRYMMFSGLNADIYPRFKSIKGLSPTIALKQNLIKQTNPNSTVGSKSQIGNVMALLYAQYGEYQGRYMPYSRLSSEFFNKNTTKGMCLKCLGKGSYHCINIQALLTPDTLRLCDLLSGHIVKKGEYRKQLNAFCRHYSLHENTEIRELTEEQKKVLVFGDPAIQFDGMEWIFNDLTGNTIFDSSRRHMDIFQRYSQKVQCDKCDGYGLSEIALQTYIDGLHIGQITSMSVKELICFFRSSELLRDNILAQEILKKLNYLEKVGLSYLSLSRSMPTLSGGELQRLLLVSYIFTELNSIIFVFDEPTIGMHESEKKNLIQIIQELVAVGNTVIVVEHDELFMRAADYIIDIGPGAGIYGGELLYQGSLENFLKCENSSTAKYLSGKAIRYSRCRNILDNNKKLVLQNVNIHNIHNLNIDIPLGGIVGVAGKSGSGKSSLISYTLVPLLKTRLKNKVIGGDDYAESVMGDTQLEGVHNIRRCVIVDQKPIGRNSTSTPVSYLGVYEHIRNLFAELPLSRERGYSLGMFSYNSCGRCENCMGEGSITYNIGLDNSIQIPCSECENTGFKAEVLDVRLAGKNIYDILQMTFSEALTFFRDDSYLRKMFEVVDKVGIGYIKLGQKVKNISGGEGQRIKLAKELGKNIKDTLFILDEPTTGLSFSDIDNLIKVLDELVIKGNSIIIVEHDISVLKRCDYIIEMGPCGGIDGGRVISQGTVEDILRNPTSRIAKYLN